MDRTIRRFDSGKPGKTVAIFAGIHGNEIGGIIALRQLISDLETGAVKLTSGSLYLVFANLQAIALGTRFAELNMNRAFHPLGEAQNYLTDEQISSYERQRALTLQPLLQEAEALLDLHSTDHESSPFIICEEHSFPIAKHLPFKIISSGWDLVHPGSTDAFMNLQGKVGICVECGKHEDPEAQNRARTSIEIFLGLHGLIPMPEISPMASQRWIKAREIYKAKTHFRLTLLDLNEFEVLPAGTVIGMDGEQEVSCLTRSTLVFPTDDVPAGGEAFVLADEETI